MSSAVRAEHEDAAPVCVLEQRELEHDQALLDIRTIGARSAHGRVVNGVDEHERLGDPRQERYRPRFDRCDPSPRRSERRRPVAVGDMGATSVIARSRGQGCAVLLDGSTGRRHPRAGLATTHPRRPDDLLVTGRIVRARHRLGSRRPDSCESRGAGADGRAQRPAGRRAACRARAGAALRGEHNLVVAVGNGPLRAAFAELPPPSFAVQPACLSGVRRAAGGRSRSPAPLRMPCGSPPSCAGIESTWSSSTARCWWRRSSVLGWHGFRDRARSGGADVRRRQATVPRSRSAGGHRRGDLAVDCQGIRRRTRERPGESRGHPNSSRPQAA